jgi:hypothetical protein
VRLPRCADSWGYVSFTPSRTTAHLRHCCCQISTPVLQLNPPPRFVISPEMVEMMRGAGIVGIFTPDVLLK